MTGICIPESMTKMGGTFGCKVVVRKNIDGAEQISFEKKTLLDLISDFFSSPEVMRKSRATAVQALKKIATQLNDPADSAFNKLVSGYESGNAALNFKEIRNALRISCAPREIILPPMVYEVGNDFDCDFARFVNCDDVPVQQPKKNVEDSIPEAPTPPQVPSETSFPTYRNTRKQFEEIYRYRLGESIRSRTYKIEMIRDPDGTVSDDNLAALAETIVEIEKFTKTPFSVSANGNNDKEFRVLSGRLDSAFVDYLADHKNPFAREPADDIEKVKAEINELQRQYGNAFLRI